MKKVNLLLSGLLISATMLYAQSNKEEVEMVQSIFGMEKKAAVSEFINLEGEAATNFWQLYDEYETARKSNGQKRLNLLNKYADEYENLNDEKTNEIISEMISLGNGYNKLMQQYYKKINKACGSKAAGQFYQLEAYFQSAIRLMVLEEIPFIGEFDN